MLKGSRNTDVRSRIDEQVKALAAEVVQATKSFQPQIDTDSDVSDEDSEMETTIPNTQAQVSHVSNINIQPSSSEKTKRQAPAIPSTPPAKLLPWSTPLNLSKPTVATSTTDSGGSPHAGDPNTPPGDPNTSQVTNV